MLLQWLLEGVNKLTPLCRAFVIPWVLICVSASTCLSATPPPTGSAHDPIAADLDAYFGKTPVLCRPSDLPKQAGGVSSAQCPLAVSAGAGVGDGTESAGAGMSIGTPRSG